MGAIGDEGSAMKDESVAYSIGLPENNLKISKATPLKLPPEQASWIRVERFVTGTVENVGGKQKTNLHITVPGEKNLLVVESSKDMLRGFDKVYSEVTLKISYEYHPRTLEKKNFHLVKIISAKPAFSREERMAKLKKVADGKSGRTFLTTMRGCGICRWRKACRFPGGFPDFSFEHYLCTRAGEWEERDDGTAGTRDVPTIFFRGKLVFFYSQSGKSD